MADDPSGSFRVVIAGGGVAGLEAALALRDRMGDGVALAIVTPEPEFVYRPMAVAEPFARGQAQRHALAEIAADLGAELVLDRLEAVDGAARTATTAGGRELAYDALLVAVGAGWEPAFERALTWTPESDADVYGGVLADIEQGYAKRLAFVIPEGVYWPLPAYELALMTGWDVDSMGQEDVDIVVYTHEDAPLEVFGAQASAALAGDLAEVRVRVRTGMHVRPGDGGRLVAEPAAPGAGEAVDLSGQVVVALPRAVGRPPRGLPTDERGFVPCDRFGAVPGVDAVWVAGDAAAFPIKQGGLAAQQADVAAGAIAARAGAGGTPEPFRPVLRGVLLTGRGRAWMRHDPGADDASVAARRALFWPPTKIAGRYLSPYLARLDDTGAPGGDARPGGAPVELDLLHELPDP